VEAEHGGRKMNICTTHEPNVTTDYFLLQRKNERI
jgi:hypothetical protein